MNGIQKAIKAAGGQAALARKIDVTPQNIWNWLHTTGRVPPDKCQRVAAARFETRYFPTQNAIVNGGVMNSMKLEMCIADMTVAVETYMNEHVFQNECGVAKVKFDQNKHMFVIELGSPIVDEVAS